MCDRRDPWKFIHDTGNTIRMLSMPLSLTHSVVWSVRCGWLARQY